MTNNRPIDVGCLPGKSEILIRLSTHGFGTGTHTLCSNLARRDAKELASAILLARVIGNAVVSAVACINGMFSATLRALRLSQLSRPAKIIRRRLI